MSCSIKQNNVQKLIYFQTIYRYFEFYISYDLTFINQNLEAVNINLY
jgi:hypothetical protein